MIQHVFMLCPPSLNDSGCISFVMVNVNMLTLTHSLCRLA